MATATLVEAGVAHMPPVTNIYDCGDHRLMVLSVSIPDLGTILSGMGLSVPIARSHITPEVDVFFCDERGVPIDADGDPLNGLTPFASTNPESARLHELPESVLTASDPYGAALSVLGYELVEEVE